MTASAVISRPMGLRSFPSATRPRSTPDSAASRASRPPETGPVANSPAVNHRQSQTRKLVKNSPLDRQKFAVNRNLRCGGQRGLSEGT